VVGDQQSERIRRLASVTSPVIGLQLHVGHAWFALLCPGRPPEAPMTIADRRLETNLSVHERAMSPCSRAEPVEAPERLGACAQGLAASGAACVRHVNGRCRRRGCSSTGTTLAIRLIDAFIGLNGRVRQTVH
jgi:hypothetical protein